MAATILFLKTGPRDKYNLPSIFLLVRECTQCNATFKIKQKLYGLALWRCIELSPDAVAVVDEELPTLLHLVPTL